MNKDFRAIVSTAVLAFLFMASVSALDVQVAVNGTANLTATNVTVQLPPSRPIAGIEQCRYINRSIVNSTYDVFEGIAQMVFGDIGLSVNDTSAKVVLLGLCGQPFINPESLIRKFVIQASGANLTAPVFYGLVDNIGYDGAILLSVVKSTKLVKILQLLNVQSGYVPPPLEFQTVFNNETKQNETTIVESKVDVLATPEWQNFTQQTLNVTTDDYLVATLNIVFNPPLELQEPQTVNATVNGSANKISDAIIGPKVDSKKEDVKPAADKNDPETKKAAEALAKDLNATVVEPPGIAVGNKTDKPAARLLYDSFYIEPPLSDASQLQDGRRLIEIISNYQSQQSFVPQRPQVEPIPAKTDDCDDKNDRQDQHMGRFPKQDYQQVPLNSVPVEVIRTSVLPKVVTVKPNYKPKSHGNKNPKVHPRRNNSQGQQQQNVNINYVQREDHSYQQVYPNQQGQQVCPNQQGQQRQPLPDLNGGNWIQNQPAQAQQQPQQQPQYSFPQAPPAEQFQNQNNNDNIFDRSHYFKSNNNNNSKNVFVGSSLQGRNSH